MAETIAAISTAPGEGGIGIQAVLYAGGKGHEDGDGCYNELFHKAFKY